MDKLIAAASLLAGLFTIVCTFKEYEFFMGHHKAQTMIRIIGVAGTKFLYYTLGLAMIVLGVVLLVHGIPET